MRNRFLQFILLLLVGFSGFSQMPLRQATWSHPVLRQLEERDSSVVDLRRAGSSLVSFAVLNKQEGVLYYFTVFGHVFDTLHLSKAVQEQIATQQLDAFQFYKEQAERYLSTLSAAKAWIRQEGKQTG